MTPLLAQRVRSPDRAFERLYRQHVGDVYRYTLAVLRNPTDAEDVTQTTFLNAYRAFQRGQRPEKPENWLIAIAHNVCRQRFRQAARRPNEVEFDEDVAEAVPLDTDGPSVDELTRALGHLAFNQRSAIVMRELEGRSYAEIGKALDISVSAVETLLFRARRALREQLEGSLTCHEAELAISRQRDGRLPRSERGALRAHLRECKECETFARSQRAQRSAWKGLAAIPIPSSLGSFLGGGTGAAVGTGAAATAGVGVAVKAAAVFTAAALVGGVGYEGARHNPWHAQKAHRTARPAPAPVASPERSGTPVGRTEVASRPVTGVVAQPKAKGQPNPKAKPHKLRAAKPKTSAARPHKALKPNPHARAKPPALTETPAAAPAASAAKPAKPPKIHKGRGLGLVASERSARRKAKPDRPAVGLARSEERSKQKAKKKAKKEAAQAAAEKRSGHAQTSAETTATATEPPPEQNGNGNGNGNGSGGNGGNGGNGNGGR
jgi:RNA polymerase sigma factor (sigma-70 family)